MNVALASMDEAQRKKFINYMDDINGGVNSFEELVAAYRSLLQMCEKNQITLKAKKTKLGFKTANVGGFEVGSGERKLAEKHMDPLRELRPPGNVSELRRVLGLFVQVNSFVPNFAIKARPLTRLTGKVPWVWGQVEQEAFVALQELTSARPTMFAPDFARRFYIDTDASEYGYGYMLYHQREVQVQEVSPGNQGAHSFWF